MRKLILNLPKQLTLRNAQRTDDGFFRQLYAETRDDLALLNGSGVALDSLIELQFKAQREGYRRDFPDADYFVIELSGIDCGRLIISQDKTSLRVVDIALLKAMRQQGVGTAVFEGLQRFTAANKQVLCLTMNPHDLPLSRFYRRLGFQIDSEKQLNEQYQFLSYSVS